MRSLIKAINSQRPFLIDYQVAQQHLQIVGQRGFTDILAGLFGDKPKPYLAGSTAVVNVQGVIGKALSPLESYGATDLDVLEEDIDRAVDAGAKRLLLNINSPGGTIEGVEEIANKVRGLKMPTIAFTSGSMDSAAYWIGAAADRVVVTGSSSVGSVGVYSVLVNSKEAARAQGVEVLVFKSGDKKGIGVPGTDVTPEQAAYLQKSVDDAADIFKASVKMKRKMLADDVLDGRSVTGREAIRLGFATGQADSLKALLTQLEGKGYQVKAI